MLERCLQQGREQVWSEAVSGRSEKGKDEGAGLSVDGGLASGLEQTIALGKINLLVFLFLICAWKTVRTKQVRVGKALMEPCFQHIPVRFGNRKASFLRLERVQTGL